jgi:hypothetical protein
MEEEEGRNVEGVIVSAVDRHTFKFSRVSVISVRLVATSVKF